MTRAARLTWLGHSTVVIELNGVNFLTDPVLRRRVLHLRRYARASVNELQIDAVLVSHVHWDHLDLPSLDLLPRDLLVVVPRGAGMLLRKRRFSNVVELARGEAMTINGAEVRATEAAHRIEAWARGSKAPALGFVVRATHTVYFAGDTDLFDGMGSLAADLDIALLPVAGWGSRLPPGHLDPHRAAQALCLLRPAVAVPIHWGTYAPIWARTSDGSAAPIEFRRFAAQLAPSVDVRVLEVGESTELR